MFKVGVGVIGVGYIGEIHARVCSELLMSKLIAVADIDERRAQEAAGKYGAGKWYRDYRDMLRDPEIDAVIIATPDHLHMEPVVAACEAGKDILLEKPIASNLQDAKTIVEAARKANVKLMVGYTCRFDPNYAWTKKTIDEGQIGKPLMVYCRRHASITEARRLAGRVWVALYLSVHDIDQILWYLNDKPRRVYAEAAKGKVYEELGVPDAVSMLVRFNGGAIGSVETCWSLVENLEWGDQKLEVIGTEGSILTDYLPMTAIGFLKGRWSFPDMIYEPQMHGRLAGALKEEDEHFMECIIKDKEPIVTGEDGVKSLEIALAAIESCKTEKPVYFA